MDIYKQIADYFLALEEQYNATICIKDFTGFLHQNNDLYKELSPFIVHNNPYCRYVKSSNEAYKRCISMIPKILKKSINLRTSFCGFCHAGMFEYVIPIIDNDNIIGAITFGCFSESSQIISQIIKKLNADFPQLDLLCLTTLYKAIPLKPDKATSNSIVLSLKIISMIICPKKIDYENTVKLITTDAVTQQDLFIERAIKYIKEHLCEKIKIEDIAKECCYSVSYTSRTFNKITGMNINSYINKLRIEVSKNYLLATDKQIAEIAELIGFDDLSYYSKTFSLLIGYSPAEFRRRFSKENYYE